MDYSISDSKGAKTMIWKPANEATQPHFAKQQILTLKTNVLDFRFYGNQNNDLKTQWNPQYGIAVYLKNHFLNKIYKQ